MITLTWAYALAGVLFGLYALLALREGRLANAAFWGLLAASFLGGDRIGDLGNGLLVLALVVLAASGRMARSAPAAQSPGALAAAAARHGNRLFLPALAIPLVALAGTLAARAGATLFDPGQATLISLAAGVLVALGVAHAWLRPRPLAAVGEGRRLMEAVGWAAVLPQLLAALGAVFAAAGVGEIVGGLFGRLIPAGQPLLAVVLYALGMAGFTVVMGNAFAAFPVMIAAIGVPVLVRGLGGDPAVIAAIGMLSGFCGTLLTPMAANFNIVPAVLLELRNRNAVIAAQAGTALPLLGVNILLMWWFGFR